MTSRERVMAAINHLEPDRVPLDLGGGPTSGMHVSTVYRLRQALKLDPPGTPVKVIEPYQMLGEIAPDLMEKLHVDVMGVSPRGTLLGFSNGDWKEWEFFDGTPVLVPGGFNTQPDENGDLLNFPDGDRSAAPSARMPKDGYYFDTIVRQEPIDDSRLDPGDNLEEFTSISADDLDYFKTTVERLYAETDKALLVNFGGTAFGDIALVPAPYLKHPRGIRDVEEWYVSTVIRKDYIKEVFRRQADIALGNLQKLGQVLGGKDLIIYMTGADFGTQNAPFLPPDAYKELYRPYHKKLNDWVHQNTSWKTFMHSCGSIMPLIGEIIEAGFDVLNPVQTSAANMDPRELKRKFGANITFWGGGVDTQHTLPFGMPEQVKKQVRENIDIFSPGGGFVFNTIHNVQAKVPVDNILAMYYTLMENAKYKQ